MGDTRHCAVATAVNLRHTANRIHIDHHIAFAGIQVGPSTVAGDNFITSSDLGSVFFHDNTLDRWR